MNDKRKKLASFLSNSQSRPMLLVLSALGAVVVFVLLSYVFSALNLFGETSTASAKVVGTPSIESIAGEGDPSVEYSRLIAEQNKELAETAAAEGGSSLPTIIRPQYSLNTEGFDQEYQETKQVVRDKDRCSRENLIKARNAGVSASELKCYGCSAEDMRLAGYTAAELRAAGFSAEELRAAGFSVDELRAAGFSAAELRAAGFSADELLAAGYSAKELLDSGYTPKQLLSAGVSIKDLREAGVDAASLLADGVNPADLIDAGYCANGVRLDVANPKKLRADGVKAEDLFDGGTDVASLLEYGYTTQELLNAGVSVSQLLAAGVDSSDIITTGVSRKEVSFAEKNLSQLKGGVCTTEYATAQYTAGVRARVLIPLGCSTKTLYRAGFSARDLVSENVTAGQLRVAGYTASNLVAAGVPLKELVEGCFSIDSLLEAGFSASQLADAGVPIADLLAHGFSVGDLAQSGVSCGDLYKGGVSVAELYAHGCSAQELKNAGASAAELLGAGYSVSDLRAAGFSAADLYAAGVSAEDMLAAGFSADELLAAGYTKGQLIRAGVSADLLYQDAIQEEESDFGCSVERINAAFSDGKNARDLLDKGCSLESLLAAGVTPCELVTAEEPVEKLVKVGISVSDLISCGVTTQELVDAKADPKQLYLAGIKLKDIKGYALEDLVNAGYDVPKSGDKAFDIFDEDSSETDLERIQRMQNEAFDKQDRERRIAQLSAGMQAQATSLMSSWEMLPQQSVSVGSKKPSDFSANSGTGGWSSAQEGFSLGPVVKAGTMMYATMDSAVNSDDPTPIRASIVSGPLKGAHILGEFEQNDEKLVLKFDRVDIATERNTKDIELFAVDVNTARNVSIDSHYLLKYGSLFAASFLEGLNEVAGSLGTTVSVEGNNVVVKEGGLSKTKVIAAGLGKVGSNLVSQTEQFQSKEPTIRMKVGATFGILVMEDFTL